MAESDLYLPVKGFLTARGYVVRAEVGDLDVMAVEPEGDRRVIAVELKPNLCLDVLVQAMKRMNGVDAVYVAVGVPEGLRALIARDRDAADHIRLCKMLGFGFLRVHGNGWVEVMCEPEEYRPRPNAHYRLRLLKEFNGRTGDHNVGGTTKRPRITAYREAALRIAVALRDLGGRRVILSDIKAATNLAKTAGMLRSDPYEWFIKDAGGVYSLSPKGWAALNTYSDVVDGHVRAA
jgi:hypothetical protein